MHRLPRLLVLLLITATVGAQQKRPLEIEDLFRMKRIASPVVSPDGRWVVYTLTIQDLAANTSSSDLWMSAVDGSSTRCLTTHPSTDRTAAWSPDGRWIAFVSERSGESQIWLLPVAGGEPRQLTTLSTGAEQAVWSPDGSRIAFVSSVFPEFSGRPFRLSDSLNADALQKRALGAGRVLVTDRLLYRHWNTWNDGRRKHIFLQPVEGGEARDLTPGDRDAVPTSSTFSGGIDFAFSPDGKEIAYTATPVPVREEAWRTNHDLFIVPVAGGPPIQVTANPAADGFPRYSPDGRYLFYRAQSVPGFEADRWQLMLLERATGVTRSLTATFDASVTGPVWAPDSRTIYFESDEKGEVPIFAVTVAGNDVRRVLTGASHSSISVTPDARSLVFSRVSAVRPAELARVHTDGTGFQFVTSVNDAVFASLDIPPPESVWYAGADGVKIQAWLYRPPNFDPSRKYPLVCLIHGGPQGAWEDGWSYRWNPPLWAAQGYVILAPNPRGSTGFGQLFVNQISGDWGGKVFVDVMNGVDYAQSLPYVDRTRTAAAGASFGGYMVNWLQAKVPERFSALITHCGVYNFVSMYGSTDEVWFDEWDHAGTPWDKPEEYAKYSPHTYAKNFKAPHLILHGANDFRIPYTEAMQLFTALQRQGVPSRFVFFPDESHWVLKPANSRFWHRTVFDWLAQYLKKS